MKYTRFPLTLASICLLVGTSAALAVPVDMGPEKNVGPIECDGCKWLVGKVQTYLKNSEPYMDNLTETALEANICTHIPSKDTTLCDGLVEKYVPVAFDSLVEKMADPTFVCTEVASLCSQASMFQISENRIQKTVPAVQACSTSLTTLYEYLSGNVTTDITNHLFTECKKKNSDKVLECEVVSTHVANSVLSELFQDAGLCEFHVFMNSNPIVRRRLLEFVDESEDAESDAEFDEEANEDENDDAESDAEFDEEPSEDESEDAESDAELDEGEDESEDAEPDAELDEGEDENETETETEDAQSDAAAELDEDEGEDADENENEYENENENEDVSDDTPKVVSDDDANADDSESQPVVTGRRLLKFKKIIKKAANVVKTTAKVAVKVAKAVAPVAIPALSIIPGAGIPLTVIKTAAPKLTQAVIKVKSVVDKVKAAKGQVGGIVNKVAPKLKDVLKKTASKVTPKVKEALKKTASKVTPKVKEALKKTASKVAPKVKEALKKTASKVAPKVKDALKKTASKVAPKVKDALKKTASKVTPKLKDALKKAGKKAGSKVKDALKKAGKKAGSKVKDALKKAGKKADSKVKDALKKAGNKAGSKVKDALKKAGKKAGSKVKDALKKAGAKLKTGLKKLVPTKLYGNYCGPNYCGGKHFKGAEGPNCQWGVASKDELDECCKAHDRCCGTESMRSTNCNKEILACAKKAKCSGTGCVLAKAAVKTAFTIGKNKVCGNFFKKNKVSSTQTVVANDDAAKSDAVDASDKPTADTDSASSTSSTTDDAVKADASDASDKPATDTAAAAAAAAADGDDDNGSDDPSTVSKEVVDNIPTTNEKLNMFKDKLVSVMSEMESKDKQLDSETKSNVYKVETDVKNEALRIQAARKSLTTLYNEMASLNNTIQTHYDTLLSDSDYIQSLDKMRPKFMKSLEKLTSHIEGIKTLVDNKLIKDEYKDEMLTLLNGIRFNAQNISGYVATAFINHYNKYKSRIQGDNTDYLSSVSKLSKLSKKYKLQEKKTASLERERARLESILLKLKTTMNTSKKTQSQFESMFKQILVLFDKNANSNC
jgi:hypothetical protein